MNSESTNPYRKPEAQDQPVEDKGNIGKGFGMALLANVALVFICALFRELWIIALFAIGLVQLLAIVPLWIYFGMKKESKTIQGILILAGITFLLNAGCYGLVFASIGNIH